MEDKGENKDFKKENETLFLQLLAAGAFCLGLLFLFVWVLAMLGADGQSRLPWEP